MRRGKADTLKVLHGNPGKRAIAPDLKPAKGLGAPPRHFGTEERREWLRVVEAMPKGVLKETDRPVLTLYCQHMVAFEAASKAMVGQPLVIVQPSGRLAANPLIAIRRLESVAVTRCCQELGFSPAARTRVHVDTSADENEFDDLMPTRRPG